jgi:hypothetical protein
VTSGEGFIPPTEKIAVKSEEGVAGGIAGSLRDFLRALGTGEKPQGECHDNIKSLGMVFGAIESARTGARVQIRY